MNKRRSQIIDYSPYIFGIKGISLAPEEIILFKEHKPIGFILFSRNINSRNQLIALVKSLKGLYSNPLIFVDQEGGRVARIKPPIVNNTYPNGDYFAKIYDTDPNRAKSLIYDNYFKLMQDLNALGINSPCAPVCDIRYDNTSDAIGDRSFGNEASKVIDLSIAAITAIVDAGGIPFIKHMPGHGRSTLDTHYDLPTINEALNILEATDFEVFKRLASTPLATQNKIWGMTAHIIYNAVDPIYPATISQDVITYIRNNIGFVGPLVSDDLCMYALHGTIGRKYSLLKKIIKLTEQQENAESLNIIESLYGDTLKELFDIQVHNTYSALISRCNVELTKLAPQFQDSLAKISMMTLKAGCDIVLHCSGDIDEMRSIVNSRLKNKQDDEIKS